MYTVTLFSVLTSVWVAMRVPDGYVTGHANQARIQTFPLDSSEDCLYSADVVTFAQKIGLYPVSSPPESFSFSDVYDPVTFSGARFCDARVWSFFSAVMGQEWSDRYLDYAMGYNLVRTSLIQPCPLPIDNFHAFFNLNPDCSCCHIRRIACRYLLSLLLHCPTTPLRRSAHQM